MKYNELKKRLTAAGCYATGKQRNGHPEWYSPITNKKFKFSHHGNQEVADGTLIKILKDAGLK